MDNNNKLNYQKELQKRTEDLKESIDKSVTIMEEILNHPRYRFVDNDDPQTKIFEFGTYLPDRNYAMVPGITSWEAISQLLKFKKVQYEILDSSKYAADQLEFYNQFRQCIDRILNYIKDVPVEYQDMNQYDQLKEAIGKKLLTLEIQVSKKSESAYFKLIADTELYPKRVLESIKEFEDKVLNSPAESTRFFSLKGTCYLHLRQYQNCIDCNESYLNKIKNLENLPILTLSNALLVYLHVMSIVGNKDQQIIETCEWLLSYPGYDTSSTVNIEILFYLGTAFFRDGDLTKASKILKEASVHPALKEYNYHNVGAPVIFLNLARISNFQKNIQQRNEYLESTIKYLDDVGESKNFVVLLNRYLTRIDALSGLNRDKETLLICQNAVDFIKLNTSTSCNNVYLVEIYTKMAQITNYNREYGKSLEYLRNVKEYVDHYPFHTMLVYGEALFQSDDLEKASIVYRDLINLNQDSPGSYLIFVRSFVAGTVSSIKKYNQLDNKPIYHTSKIELLDSILQPIVGETLSEQVQSIVDCLKTVQTILKDSVPQNTPNHEPINSFNMCIEDGIYSFSFRKKYLKNLQKESELKRFNRFINNIAQFVYKIHQKPT
ncbi:hypothetical protein DLAC_06507 [Tieghemostelium lacteum]|uniref:Uncharacterized protein n=1 Tax=Tieghemostelium lacteum TaxID=361077 RepID=A0A151ZEX9_TIELA|nr:hypothetical protein DLAC_06507 [Tieghemostelium lacteum]|eukprot:KYQ92518.1 hypothetical protein DLAC_06507 [Tieghemostelium lacteum]